jgi:beta-glucosidase
MGPRRRMTALAATVVAISLMVAGGVMAATESRDEAALQPARGAADRGIEGRVDRLLSQMTLEEKLQQVQLLSDGQITDEDARRGAGSSAWSTP